MQSSSRRNARFVYCNVFNLGEPWLSIMVAGLENETARYVTYFWYPYSVHLAFVEVQVDRDEAEKIGERRVNVVQNCACHCL